MTGKKPTAAAKRAPARAASKRSGQASESHKRSNARSGQRATSELDARAATWINNASFWHPGFLAESAWIQHGPFAFWLASILKPRSFVELGTHGGFSYFAFCQAVKALGLDTSCFAVDTWKGDVHAGLYAESVFEKVNSYNDAHYAGFSRLVRSTFDEALPNFPDGSIDLLHVDGRHFYEDVKHDYETWRPKLSSRAVVLFHDTNVRERDFGVHRLWSELCNEYPSFEFRNFLV